MILCLLLFLVFVVNLILNYLYLTKKRTAIKIVNDMGFGYNLGDNFNCNNNNDNSNFSIYEMEYFKNETLTRLLISKLKKNGFKTIRLNLPPINFKDNFGNIDLEWISKAKKIVDIIIAKNMYCILDVQHNFDFWKDKGLDNLDKYAYSWKQISEEFKDYDDKLIFESKNEFYYYEINNYDKYGIIYYSDYSLYIPLINTTQCFVDIVRNSSQLNKERLLIINLYVLDTDISSNIVNEMPFDPYNKTAVSIHYYFPGQYSFYRLNTTVTFYYLDGSIYTTLPQNTWGTKLDYVTLLNYLEIYKEKFTDKGIPLIFGEVGIFTNGRMEIQSNTEFLYALFSILTEYDGIMANLWDNCQMTNDLFYYNKETGEWNDKRLRDNFLKISRNKHIKKSEFNYRINFDYTTEKENMQYYIDIGNKHVTKIILNTTWIGERFYYFDFYLSCLDINGMLKEYLFDKKQGKRTYDGDLIFTIDVNEGECTNYIQALIFYGEEYFRINELKIEYKEFFTSFDYKSYKAAISKEIS